ncbi:M42 family aminopeptidase [[Mycoplasma] cavipharyngis]|uniref:M42 family peptidase n=1 Tax=[Mycoplasma] cavipharyngis TaxID=92757 RepID=UPI0037036DF2
MNDELKKSYQTIIKYMQVDGLSGYEEAVVDLFKQETAKIASHNQLSYQRDGLGSIIAHYPNAKGPKILLVGHLDEIGFLVQDIYDNGQIAIANVGGIWPQAITAAKVELTTSSQKKFLGVIGHTSIHILPFEKQNQALKMKDLFADFGFVSKDDAIAHGVEVGDLIHFKTEPFLMQNNLFAGKAIDNRISLAILELLIENLKDDNLINNPYFVATSQEEVGCRGAKTIATKIKADLAIVIDVCASHDTQGAIPGNTKLNQGVAIAVKDAYNLINPKLLKYIVNLAQSHQIPIVKYISQGGGTDASEIQFGSDGLPTLIVSIPERYLHCSIGVSSLDDFNHLVNLLTVFIKSFNSESLKQIQYH